MELSKRTVLVLEALKASGVEMTAGEIASLHTEDFAKGQASVNPLINGRYGLIAKGLAVRAGEKQVEGTDKDGNPVVRSVATYIITDAGVSAEYTVKA